MSSANGRLTPAGRLTLVQHISAGRPVAHATAEMGVSRSTAWWWVASVPVRGSTGVVDRPEHGSLAPAPDLRSESSGETAKALGLSREACRRLCDSRAEAHARFLASAGHQSRRCASGLGSIPSITTRSETDAPTDGAAGRRVQVGRFENNAS